MSSVSQKAVVFSYPGATSKSILTKLKDDPKFKHLDPTKVKNIFVFCGTNDVDNILSISRHFQSEIVKTGNYCSSENLINRVNFDFIKLVDFLHNWSCNADVNVLNILPRESIVRNEVINILNYHIVNLKTMLILFLPKKTEISFHPKMDIGSQTFIVTGVLIMFI